MEKWEGYEEEKEMVNIIEYKLDRCIQSLSDDILALGVSEDELCEMLGESMEPQSEYNLSVIHRKLHDIIKCLQDARETVKKRKAEYEFYYKE